MANFYAKYPSASVSLTISGTSNVQGLGTPGSALGGVLTVQGDPAGTPIPISGSFGLPAGAATSALQTSGNASLTSIDGKTPSLGQATMAASQPVVIASNQSAVPVSGSVSVSNFPATQPVSGSVSVSNFPATQPVSGTVAATQSGTWTVQPGNTPNTVAWKVDGSAVTQPVSGTFFQATQPVSGSVSVSNFPATQPVSGTVAATQSGTWNIGTVTAVTAITNALPTGANTIGAVNVNGTVPVSGTFFQATQPVSGTVAATQSGTWNIGTVTTVSAVTAITNALPTGANTIGAVTGSGTFTTNQTTSAVTWQAEGSIAAGALTTSFATAFTTAGGLVWVGMRNNTNGIVVVSLDGGTTSSFTLDPGDQVSLDLKPQGKSIAAAVNIQAKYTGSAPTTGSIRINGYY
jgi:hypothetical protein